MAERSGTQSIERAVLLLKQLAARSTFGWRLSDLAAACELDKGTAHRMLRTLQRERLVQQRLSDRHYLPGPLLFELSLALPGLIAFQAAAHAPLQRIARRFGGVAFMYLRSGGDFVCAARVGTSLIKALSVEVGTRRPLVTSAGGAAILVALPKGEADPIIAQNMKQIARVGDLRTRSVERMLRRSQSHGFGVNLGEVVPGVNAFGVAVRDAQGTPFASITIAGLAEDLPLSAMAQVVATLDEEARVLCRAAVRLLPERGI